jgi:putative serine protease PepD
MTDVLTLERPPGSDVSLEPVAPPPPSLPPPSESPPGEPAAKPPSPHSRRRRALAAAAAAVLVLAGGTAGGVIGVRLTDSTAAPTASTVDAVQVATGGTVSLAQVAAAVSPSVVTITVSAMGQSAEGSGVVLSADGRILTNNHVIAGAGSAPTIRVHFASGATAAATVVGRDATTDIAVLQAQDVSGLTPAVLGTSADLRVGDSVLAFGSPLGLEGTVTSGIVSALNRDVDSSESSLAGLIQTDAAINAGNSGGPLVNLAGQVVGINVANATTGQDTGSIGVGFAIPIDTVKTVVDTIVARAS